MFRNSSAKPSVKINFLFKDLTLNKISRRWRHWSKILRVLAMRHSWYLGIVTERTDGE